MALAAIDGMDEPAITGGDLDTIAAAAAAVSAAGAEVVAQADAATTTTIAAVQTDIAEDGGTTPVVPVAIALALGFLTLAGVTVRARRMER
ncbi:MAG: hypothetical protein BMS9Abin17_1015 [Acidimicrobiia bacterium]|nr:MAG: hypothetical protein BMS9Abin17_1015 [Acidimicrobiia bacterium]